MVYLNNLVPSDYIYQLYFFFIYTEYCLSGKAIIKTYLDKLCSDSVAREGIQKISVFLCVLFHLKKKRLLWNL